MSDIEEKYSVTDIYPPINEDQIQEICKYHNIKTPNNFDIPKLDDSIKNKLIQIYIKKSIKDKFSIKSRFYQFILYAEEYKDYSISSQNIQDVDIILKNDAKNHEIWILIVEYLDQHKLIQIKNDIKRILLDLKKKDNSFNNTIDLHLVCGKIERKIANEDQTISIQGQTISISYYLEFEDPNRPFTDNDLIEIGNTKLRGFNFGSLDQLLDAIKTLKGKGKYIINVEESNGNRKKIWEGFLFPAQLLK